MSRRQLAKIYPGTAYRGRKLQKWADRLFKKNQCCVACGSKTNLQPHHILPSHPWEQLHYDIENGIILCKSCHDSYHSSYFPVNKETLEQFLKKKKKRKVKKKNRKYTLKKYEPHPLYTKIKINDFRKAKPVKHKQKKRRRKKRKKTTRLNPIYILKDLGSDEWQYIDRINLEMEVLGDLNE